MAALQLGVPFDAGIILRGGLNAATLLASLRASMMAKRKKPLGRLATSSPFLRRISMSAGASDRHPFNIRAYSGGIDLEIDAPVTFFVGENGSGKSTLLETIAEICDFDPQGGSRDHRRTFIDRSDFAQALRLAWSVRVTEGFFMRAESFYNFATYLEASSSTFFRYGGKSLHAQSHGESFLALFANRFEQGLYILDEPEAALSPQRQLSFLKIIHELATPGHAQFLISTHSPILLAYPGATLFSLDGDTIEKVDYRDTAHYQVTRDFLDAPDRFFKHLFAEEPNE